MTQAIAKFAAKKMLSREMDKYKARPVESQYDPFYEMIDHPKKPGKKKKVKKQVPAYIPPHDADILARARKTAYRLDFCLFNFLGIRFGWSSVIGLVPAIGDVLDMLLAFKLIMSMSKVDCGLPGSVKAHMAINMLIDLLLGLVPFVGDLADASYKCNSKNVRVFERHLDKVYKPKRLTLAEKDMDSPPPPATVYEDFSDEEGERRDTFNDRYDDVRPPMRTYSSRRDRVPDEEMGLPRQDTHRSHRSQHNSGKPNRHGTKSSRR